MLPVIGAARPWSDPEIVSIGRLPMHVPTVGFPDADAARDADPAASPWWRSLDGRWAFALYDTPEAVPAGAVSGAVTGWRRVAVPGNWTMQDVGDLPHYTNVQMPFDGPPPRLPARNPTGVYRTTFTVPRAWHDRSVVLHLGAADSVHAVYVNGAFIGYGTDNRLASEYDVTAAAHAGRNELAVVVVRYSAHSYVEDQDQWWMAGLHRSVHIEARAATHVADVVCAADWSVDDAAGTLSVATTVAFADPAPGWRVLATLETLGGRRVGRPLTGDVPHAFDVPYVFTGHTVVADFGRVAVEAWSAESPTRYRVVVELLDPDGTVTEARSQLIGFRHVAVDDRQLLVNGQPIWVFGVNRHDHHPERGKAVTVDDMRADLFEMRRHNITAVRCSHYPNDPRFLDLCDELGMYVVDEANIESHAYNTSLCDDPRWRSAWLARGARMVERDRNHPSVILWSLGNESGYGANHDALAGWIRSVDPSRPLHYEGAILHWGWVDGGLPATDIVCPMYPPIDAIVRYGTDGARRRPLIMCEYSHAMGNSGSLAGYWAAITTTPGLQGGFIWEWKDHGLRTRLPNGHVGFAFGGQFGEHPHDGNFVADGLMSADLHPHPIMQEVAWVYRPVTVSLAGRNRSHRLRITNRQSFIGVEWLRARWELLVDGEPVGGGELDLPAIAPRSTADVDLPIAVPDGPDGGGEVHLTVRFHQRRATAWAPAGHLVAWDQVELRPRSRTKPARRAAPASGSSRPVAELLASPIELCIFRAPTDNDGFKLMPELSRRIRVGGKALAAWQDAGIDRLTADEFVRHEHRVELLDDGSEVHQHEVEVPEELPRLARIGVRFHLPAGFDLVRWFGRGPLENYPDRNSGAVLGTWEAAVDRPPYLVPQEFGLRTDCRWFECVDRSGRRAVRLEVLSPRVMHCSATHFTVEDLYVARHETELRPRRQLVVHADVAHRGLGSGACGPDVPPGDEIEPGTHRFAYRLVRTR